MVRAGRCVAVLVATLVSALGMMIGGAAPASAQDSRVWSLKAVPITLTEGVEFSGPVACIELHAGSFTDADWAPTIEWGDGTVEAGTIGGDDVCSIGYSVEGTHTYAVAGTYSLKVRVEDLVETGSFATLTRQVTVAFAPNDFNVGISAAPNPVKNNGKLTYTVLVTNGSANISTNVWVNLTLPAGAQLQSVRVSQGSCFSPPIGTTGTIACELGSLPANGVATLNATVKVLAGGGSSVQATATAGADDPDPISANNTATVETRVFGRR
jgi:uncharacterized repeat protein (TIGR01451 family)